MSSHARKTICVIPWNCAGAVSDDVAQETALNPNAVSTTSVRRFRHALSTAYIPRRAIGWLQAIVPNPRSWC